MGMLDGHEDHCGCTGCLLEPWDDTWFSEVVADAVMKTAGRPASRMSADVREAWKDVLGATMLGATKEPRDDRLLRMRAWVDAKRNEGKCVGIHALVGHKVPKSWFVHMLRIGCIERERCPGTGLYAYWWV